MMERKKALVIAALTLLLIAAAVYSYFLTSESQSSVVQRVDPGKAEMIRQLQESAATGIPEAPRPPNE